MKFEEVLRTFADYFERNDIRYAVIGGLALQAALPVMVCWICSMRSKGITI